VLAGKTHAALTGDKVSEHLGTRAFHNCKLRLLESVLPIFHHPDEPTCEGLRRLIDELIEHISGDSKAYVWLWHNSARMCETSTGCRGAGVHTPRRACGALEHVARGGARAVSLSATGGDVHLSTAWPKAWHG